MKTWTANMLVCDDVLVSVSGKFNLLGVYSTDIGVPKDGQIAPQLVFFFMLEGDLSERPHFVSLEVSFPGGNSRSITVPAQVPQGPAHGRTKWFARIPFLVQQVMLRPGKIEAKVRYDGQELAVAGPWIVAAHQEAGADGG
jgi:hypothetical protein